MRDEVVGRALRMARLRKGWRQLDVARAAQISRATVARGEAGRIARLHLHTLRAHGAALGLRVDLVLVGRAGEVPRLLDDEHAAIVELLVGWLTRTGWIAEPEASYSVRGERGRVDVLAWHPATRTLVVVEAKSELTDLQDLFGSLNAKTRLAPVLARERGWAPARVAVLLAVASTHVNRVRVAAHPSLFGEFGTVRGDPATWVRTRDPGAPRRMLLWIAAGQVARTRWLAGRQRVSRTLRKGAERSG